MSSQKPIEPPWDFVEAGWFEPDRNGPMTGELPTVACLGFIRTGIPEGSSACVC